jgi:hypothetical protein
VRVNSCRLPARDSRLENPHALVLEQERVMRRRGHESVEFLRPVHGMRGHP